MILRKKKLEKENIIEVYNILNYSLYLINNFNFLKKIYNCIKFNTIDHK